VLEIAGRPLHRETTVDETAQLTVDTVDVDVGSMPSVLYMRISDAASFCTDVAVVDAVDGDEVTAVVVVAVDVRRRSDTFLSGEQMGQSGRTQFFQCRMICRRGAQCCTDVKHTNSTTYPQTILLDDYSCLKDSYITYFNICKVRFFHTTSVKEH